VTFLVSALRSAALKGVPLHDLGWGTESQIKTSVALMVQLPLFVRLSFRLAGADLSLRMLGPGPALPWPCPAPDPALPWP
jgi:hypothetical protein